MSNAGICQVRRGGSAVYETAESCFAALLFLLPVCAGLSIKRITKTVLKSAESTGGMFALRS